MNAKRAKAMRQALRLHQINPAESVLMDRGEDNFRLVRDGVNPDGSPKLRRFDYTGTKRLDPNSGRAVYRASKKLGLNPFRG